MTLLIQIPMWNGINKTIEYFRSELQRKRHSERNVWIPDSLKQKEGQRLAIDSKKFT